MSDSKTILDTTQNRLPALVIGFVLLRLNLEAGKECYDHTEDDENGNDNPNVFDNFLGIFMVEKTHRNARLVVE